MAARTTSLEKTRNIHRILVDPLQPQTVYAGAIGNPYAEHPQDILRQWLDWRRTTPVALVIVTRTAGGSVRAPGALMPPRPRTQLTRS